MLCLWRSVRDGAQWPRLLRTAGTLSDGDVYDVAIVGGGMVGAALAALLAVSSLRPDLQGSGLQAQPLDWRPAEVPELRVSTLTPASISYLQRAGAWQDVQPWAAAFSAMQVWDSLGGGSAPGGASGACIRWHASDASMEHMGVVVENSRLQTALLAAAAGRTQPETPQSQAWSPDPGLADSLGIKDLSSASGAAGGASEGSSGSGSQGSSSGSGSGGSETGSAAAAAGGVEFLWPAQLASLQLPGHNGSSSSQPGQQINAAGSTPGSLGGGVGAGRAATAGQAGAGAGLGGNDSQGLATLTLQCGRVLRSRLVVAADGASSQVRQLVGLRTWGVDYQQRGLVATVRCAGELGCQETAWQRFLPTGPLALLPVRGGLANVVWSTTPDMARQLERLEPEAFASVVNKALNNSPAAPETSALHPAYLAWAVLGRAARAAQRLASPAARYVPPPLVQGWLGQPPRSFPLHLRQAGRYVAPRLALIGDAAHAVHPLAGQGVNLGLADAWQLAQALARARQVGQDPGDAVLLEEEYDVPRRRASLAMTASLDGLRQTFAMQSAPFAAARNLGLGLLNAAGPLKTAIMNEEVSELKVLTYRFVHHQHQAEDHMSTKTYSQLIHILHVIPLRPPGFVNSRQHKKTNGGKSRCSTEGEGRAHENEEQRKSSWCREEGRTEKEHCDSQACEEVTREETSHRTQGSCCTQGPKGCCDMSGRVSLLPATPTVDWGGGGGGEATVDSSGATCTD
ncbi:hypothetical protein QJQ45_021116 [Haematococcus lacustris]|nr:hypothetical protein QJQ45_021116 [Haematococcus lacustris]